MERPGPPVDGPDPVKGINCGLLDALSVTLSEAVRVPAAVGVKVTLIVQLAPAATLDPQVFVCAKSPGSVPVRLILRFSCELPAAVRTMGCDGLVVPIA
jgi:hypothetical protein